MFQTMYESFVIQGNDINQVEKELLVNGLRSMTELKTDDTLVKEWCLFCLRSLESAPRSVDRLVVLLTQMQELVYDHTAPVGGRTQLDLSIRHKLEKMYKIPPKSVDAISSIILVFYVTKQVAGGSRIAKKPTGRSKR